LVVFAVKRRFFPYFLVFFIFPAFTTRATALKLCERLLAQTPHPRIDVLVIRTLNQRAPPKTPRLFYKTNFR
jgi:hypothetical protein